MYLASAVLVVGALYPIPRTKYWKREDTALDFVAAAETFRHCLLGFLTDFFLNCS